MSIAPRRKEQCFGLIQNLIPRLFTPCLKRHRWGFCLYLFDVKNKYTNYTHHWLNIHTTYFLMESF